ncbi:hypothetical protein AB4521_24545 [Vibrio cyclitrophicus]
MSTSTKAAKSGFNKMNFGLVSGVVIAANFTEFLGILGYIALALTPIYLIVKLFD